MTRESFYFSFSKRAVFFGYTRKHVCVKVSDSLDNIHVTQEELNGRKELRDAIRLVLFDNFLKVSKCNKVNW